MARDGTPAGSAASLFNNPLLSDVKIKQIYKGKTREYSGHKAILCFQSSFFMKAFTGNFAEATSNEIELHDDDPAYFEFVLKVMYTQEYDTSCFKVAVGSEKQVLIPINITEIADKYDIPRLVEPASKDLAGILDIAHKDPGPAYITINAAVDKYYEFCTQPASPVGTVLATKAIQKAKPFCFTNAIKRRPVFGADIMLHSISRGGIY